MVGIGGDIMTADDVHLIAYDEGTLGSSEDPQERANAFLMAAAPELLELALIVKDWGDHGYCHCCGLMPDKTHWKGCITVKATAAVTKATKVKP